MDRRASPLKLRLLGGIELRSDSAPDAPSPGRKVRALLAYLALSPDLPFPREKLMALLWGDRAEEQARASLRQALTELRHALGEPSPLRTEQDTVSLDSSDIVVDAVEFPRLIKAGKLAEAAALYRGPLLDGHGVRDGAFEDWLQVERTRLHNLAIDVLHRLTASLSGDAAIENAQRLLQLDPVREETHRLLMRHYAGAGQRAQALRQYQLCRDALRRDLQTTPDRETERLYREIQDESLPARPTETDSAKPDHAAPLESRPSLAVLPFTNLSGDPEQQYFSDGITEDIITELARFRSLFVIARNSCFQFRGPSFDHNEVRRKLGIRYLVEGSVRKLGDAIRITAQLIDAESGSHLWAERYDRDWRDIFAVQDELVRTIVATIEGRVGPSVVAEARRRPTKDLSAYDLFLQGRDFMNRYDTHTAQAPLRKAVGLDPTYAAAHGWLGVSLLMDWVATGDETAIADALFHGETAVALDADDSQCHALLAHVLLFMRRYEEALFHYERAVQLNPNDCTAQALYAYYLLNDGQAAAALERFEVVLQRDPFPSLWYWEFRGLSLYQLHRYDEAAAAFLKQGKSDWAHAYLAASLAMAERMDDARREITTYLAVAKTETRLSEWGRTDPYRHQADLEHLLDGLRKAGLPE